MGLFSSKEDAASKALADRNNGSGDLSKGWAGTQMSPSELNIYQATFSTPIVPTIFPTIFPWSSGSDGGRA